MQEKNRTWAEVNLDYLEHNFRELTRITGNGSNGTVRRPGADSAEAADFPKGKISDGTGRKSGGEADFPKGKISEKTKVMCIVKANGYGHGSCVIAKRLAAWGCTYFGVAALDEAIELRKDEIGTPILVLNHISKERVPEALAYDIALTVFEREMADVISVAAVEQGRQAKIHIKLDTGMTRVGFPIDTACDSIAYIHALPYIEIEGVYTHFSSADEMDRHYTQMQFEKYNRVVSQLTQRGISIPIKHVANSAATLRYPEMHLDMVRVGIALYGCYPTEEGDRDKINLKPCLQLKTQVIRINEVEPGVSISYGRVFTTSRKSKIATLLIGYGDGISRMLMHKLKVLINGQLAPVVGSICMDQCMVDITDIEGLVQVGDEAVIFGTQMGSETSVEQVAAWMGTIHYEILCMVSRRVPRFYMSKNEAVEVENYLIIKREGC